MILLLGLWLSVPYLAGVGLQQSPLPPRPVARAVLSVPYLAGVGLQHGGVCGRELLLAAFSSLFSGSRSATAREPLPLRCRPTLSVPYLAGVGLQHVAVLTDKGAKAVFQFPI